MKHKFSFRIGGLIIGAAVIININSCSVIGYGIGSISDSSLPDHNKIPVSQLKTMEPGAQIVITLKDANVLSGKYLGFEYASAEQYSDSYMHAR